MIGGKIIYFKIWCISKVKIEILYINIVKEIIIMHIKSVAVFCGSKTGKNPAFMEAIKLG